MLLNPGEPTYEPAYQRLTGVLCGLTGIYLSHAAPHRSCTLRTWIANSSTWPAPLAFDLDATRSHRKSSRPRSRLQIHSIRCQEHFIWLTTTRCVAVYKSCLITGGSKT